MQAINVTIIGWWGAYPDAGDATSGYLLQSGACNILLECGSGILAQVQNFIKLERIDAVVVSHYHADHVADLQCLQYASRILMDLGRRGRPLDVYGHAEDHHFASLGYLDYSPAHAVKPGSPLNLGDATITFWPNIHPDPCYSMRIENTRATLVYIADTEWYDGLTDIARGADLLICESSLYNAYKNAVPGHLTAGEAGRIARQGQVKQLVLSHLPHFGNHRDLVAQAAESFKGPIELARTGRSWSI